MKKLTALLSVLIVICLLCSTVVFAQTAETESETAVLDVDSVVLSDLAARDSYVLTDENVPVMVVEHHTEVMGATAALNSAADNGYYTAEFCIPGATKKVFLTGLTRDNVAEIEAAIIASYAEGEDFDLTDLGFIDTEKTSTEDADDDMCWAAAASNILAYTGWGALGGFENVDDIFELFINEFEADGGSTYYGVEWFFDGMDEGALFPESGFPRVVNYPDSGAFIADYTFDTVTQSYKFDSDGVTMLCELLRQLKSGRGVELGLNLYYSDGESGGHAVTCWGFVTDTRYGVDDAAYYDSVFITDSDSDKNFEERRDAPDVMDMDALTFNPETGRYSFEIIEDYCTAFLDNAVTLKPYSDDVPKETSSAATRNRTTHPDALIDNVILSTSAVTEDDTGMSTFPTGSDIYYNVKFRNSSDKSYNGNLTINLKITNSQGIAVGSIRLPFGNQQFTRKSILSFADNEPLAENLAAGIYTITAEINPEHTVAEAYYFNNTFTSTFAVGNAYIIGDVDDDQSVSTIDVTLILRKTVKRPVDLDESADIRGDINDDGYMNVIDATYIQRHLAEINIPYQIECAALYS